jgi:hypothetical protein
MTGDSMKDFIIYTVVYPRILNCTIYIEWRIDCPDKVEEAGLFLTCIP